MFKKFIFKVKNYLVEKLHINKIKLGRVYYNNEEDVAILLKDGILKVYVSGKLIELTTKQRSISNLSDSEIVLNDLPIEQLKDLLSFYEEEADYNKCAEIRDIIKTKNNVERAN